MNFLYNESQTHISEEEHNVIKDYPIVLIGLDVGSVIAECILRLGFENLTLVDSNFVTPSNLTKDNFVKKDIGSKKVDVIKDRLLEINPKAVIRTVTDIITPENISPILAGQKLAINTLSLESGISCLLGTICQENRIPIVHSYNWGWGALVTIVLPDSLNLSDITKPDTSFNDRSMLKYVTSYYEFWRTPHEWLVEIIENYKKEKDESLQQLAIGSFLAASMCTHVLFNLATDKKVKKFPEFYLKTMFVD